jgi:hypothetical protein
MEDACPCTFTVVEEPAGFSVTVTSRTVLTAMDISVDAGTNPAALTVRW